MQASKYRTKYTGIALLTLVALSLVPISASYADKQNDKFEQIALNNKQKVDELGALIAETFDPVETWPSYLDKEGFEEIKTAYGAAEYELGEENYKDAMKAYTDVFKMLNIYIEEHGVTLESSAEEEAQGLLVAIERGYERIERIKDANETYFNVLEKQWNDTINGWILSNLTAAEEDLAKAAAAVEVSILEWATANLTMANQHISDAFTALKKLAEWTSSWRIESFLMGIKNSVERTRGMLGQAREQDIDVDDLLDMVDSAELEIAYARSERAKRNNRAAVEHIKTIRETLRIVHHDLAQRRKGGE